MHSEYSIVPTNSDGEVPGPPAPQRDPFYEDPRMTHRPYPKRKAMLVTNNEKLMDTSGWFFNMESLPCGASIKETFYGIRIVVSIFSGMPRRHLMHFLLVFISYVLVVLTGAVQLELVDTSFFRAVGLLLAVLLSLRAENGVARRQELMEGVLDMMNCAGNLLCLFQFNPDSRRKLLDVLEFIFMDIAAWAMPASRRAKRPSYIVTCENGDLEYLPEEYRETLFMLRAKHRANISPRPLLLWLRDLCDDLFDPELACRSAGEKVDRISVIRRFHQNTEREIRTLLAKFDFLLMFRESFVTDQFRWMLETVIFVYVVLYPWCVCNESNVVLGATTAGMACVFYGLNSLTEQLEDPLHHQTQSFDLTRTFRSHFRDLERDANMREFATDWLGDYAKLGVKATQKLHNHLEGFFSRAPRIEVYPNGKAAGYCEAV